MKFVLILVFVMTGKTSTITHQFDSYAACNIAYKNLVENAAVVMQSTATFHFGGCYGQGNEIKK